MSLSLTDTDRADLARFLREAIEADRYPLSPRVRRLKELLAKIDPAPAAVAATGAETAYHRRKCALVKRSRTARVFLPTSSLCGLYGISNERRIASRELIPLSQGDLNMVSCRG